MTKTVAVETSAISKPSGASESVSQILLSDLRVAEWNARKTIDLKALGELVESIRQTNGMQVPLLVRPYVKKFYVSNGLFDDKGKVRYLACKNIVGRENLIETFSHGTVEETQAAAEARVLERNGAGDFEIVAGHRRFEALKRLKYPVAPCIIREMDDKTAREIGLVDNLQREDVPALEEAEAFGELLDLHGSIEAVAAKVAKEISHVAKRLKLRTLGVHQRSALALRLINVDHALLLARLGVEEQDEALKWCLDPHAGVKKPIEKQIEESAKYLRDDGRHRSWEPKSVIRLKEHIEESSGRKLSRAPWDLDDARLVPAAGSCTVCPQNTKANLALFEDLNISAATCSDGACFERKREAFVQIKLAHAGMPPGSAIRLSFKQTSTEPRWETDDPALAPALNKALKKPKLTQVFKAGQWIDAKKGSCEHVLTGVTIDWSDAGNRGYMNHGEKLRKPGVALLVCVAPKCKVHPKAWEKAKAANGSGGQRSDPKAEEAKREKTRLAALAETKLRVRLAGDAIDKIKTFSEDLLRRVLIDRLPNGGEELQSLNAICPGLEKTLRMAKIGSVEFAKAATTAWLKGRNVQCWQYWQPTVNRKEFIEDLKVLGYDASRAWDKAQVEKPVDDKAALDAKVARTAGAREPESKIKRPTEKPGPKKAVVPAKIAKAFKGLSSETRKRIADAQRKRWAQNQAAKAVKK